MNNVSAHGCCPLGGEMGPARSAPHGKRAVGEAFRDTNERLAQKQLDDLPARLMQRTSRARPRICRPRLLLPPHAHTLHFTIFPSAYREPTVHLVLGYHFWKSGATWVLTKRESGSHQCSSSITHHTTSHGWLLSAGAMSCFPSMLWIDHLAAVQDLLLGG